MKKKPISGNQAAQPNTQSSSPCEITPINQKKGKPPVQMVFDQMLPDWPGTPVPEPLMTKGEVAEHYRVCIRTVERWVAADMPRHYVGKREMRFRLSEVQLWLQENRIDRFASQGIATTMAEVRRRVVNIPILNGLKILEKSPTEKESGSMAHGNAVRPDTARISALKEQPSNVLKPKCKAGRKSVKPERSPANPCPPKEHKWKTSRYTRTCAVCGTTQERDPDDNWVESE
jgi:hypothetical protein